MLKRIRIPPPTPFAIDRSLKRWDSLENYVLQESSLKRLFTITYPRNEDLDEVLIKVCSLNDFYSTNIFSPFKVAKHIISLKIDKRLSRGDLTLVNEIALIKMSGQKTINFYSFATKYCSHHRPQTFPIFDAFTEKMLVHFNKQDNFYSFTKQDLRLYPVYHKVLRKFREFYGLTSYDLKQVDKYLWIRGKEYFPKIY